MLRSEGGYLDEGLSKHYEDNSNSLSNFHTSGVMIHQNPVPKHDEVIL